MDRRFSLAMDRAEMNGSEAGLRCGTQPAGKRQAWCYIGLCRNGGCESVLHRVPPRGLDTPGDGIEVSEAAPSEFQMEVGC